MRQHLRQCMITFAVLGCTTLMAAAQQHKLDLTQQQKQQISQALASQPSESGTNAAQAQEGSKLPTSMTAQTMPNSVAQQVPETKSFNFVKLPDKILLIDPANQMIALIVPLSATTGANPPNR
jgi:hypothetical protein